MANAVPSLQDLGFQDLPDYIQRITYDIWNGEGRQPELCITYYAPTSVIHIDGGSLYGPEEIFQNTQDRLSAFPDFLGRIDDIIWVGDDEHGYRSSMRWTWTGTNTGVSKWGEPTGRRVQMSAIANCLVFGGLITEEWLAFDPGSLARQLGLARVDTGGGYTEGSVAPSPVKTLKVEPTGAAGRLVAEALKEGFSGDADAAAAAHEDEANMRLGSLVRVTNAQGILNWFQRWREANGSLEWHLLEQYSRDEVGTAERVASRWLLNLKDLGRESKSIQGISHHRVVGDKIVASWLEYDSIGACRHLGVCLTR